MSIGSSAPRLTSIGTGPRPRTRVRPDAWTETTAATSHASAAAPPGLSPCVTRLVTHRERVDDPEERRPEHDHEHRREDQEGEREEDLDRRLVRALLRGLLAALAHLDREVPQD